MIFGITNDVFDLDAMVPVERSLFTRSL